MVIVPDEDLYEQGFWPSINNSDHKATFSLAKAESWSPVHYGLVDLVISELDSARLVSATTADTGYNYNLLGTGIDQSDSGAEVSLEIVVQKQVKYLEHQTRLRNIMVCPACWRMALIVRGTLPADSTKLDVMCNECGTFAIVTLL